VALIAVLEALDPPHPEAAAAGRRQLICVANTHIHANPELNDVKLWQARALILTPARSSTSSFGMRAAGAGGPRRCRPAGAG